MENSGGVKLPVKEVASKVNELNIGIKPDLKLMIGGRIDGAPKSHYPKPDLELIRGGKSESAVTSGEPKDVAKENPRTDGKDEVFDAGRARDDLLNGSADVMKTTYLKEPMTLKKLDYEPSIINPAVKERIKRIWGLKGVKRAILGGLAAAMLLLGRDEGPVVNREVADGKQGDQAPQARHLTSEQLADLVKGSMDIFFKSKRNPPAFPIPKEVNQGPVLGPEVPKEARPWDRIVMDKPGESLRGWVEKYYRTVFTNGKEVMMATLLNAKEKGVKVPDPVEFGKMYDANPEVAREAFDVAYRGIESKGAQLPPDHPLLQDPNIKIDPVLLDRITNSFKGYIERNNQKGALDGDRLTNAQTTIGRSPLTVVREAAIPATK